MPPPPSIQHLTREQIDLTGWNACIESADNSSPYALSEYLDALCPHWEALVQGNYERVMPLPVRKKFGIRYVYHPALVPHLGVYGKALDPSVLNAFFHAIPLPIRYIDLPVNPASLPDSPAFPLTRRKNYILPLTDDSATLQSRYRENHQRNIQRARKAGCRIDPELRVHEVWTLVKEYVSPKLSMSEREQKSFLQLMDRWIEEGRAEIYGVRVQDRLVAGALFLRQRPRAYYLLAGNHPDGKTLGASHFLIDAFIQANAGTDWVLDFEGSDLPSLAFFYEGFGSTSETYGWIQLNRLPRWLRCIKS